MKNIPRIAVLLDNGFEIAEAMICIDILRRTKVQVDILSCSSDKDLLAYLAIPVQADDILANNHNVTYDAILMPGGAAGTDNLTANSAVIEFVQRHIVEGKYICALCSAGAKVLAAHNLLGKHSYTSSGKLHEKFSDGHYIEQDVVIDKPFITGRGLGVSFEFALTVAKVLHENSDKEYRDFIDFQAEHIYFKHWN